MLGYRAPRLFRTIAGVEPGDKRSTEQLRETVISQEQPRSATLYRATASDKKPH
jgi:hypothetical protein